MSVSKPLVRVWSRSKSSGLDTQVLSTFAVPVLPKLHTKSTRQIGEKYINLHKHINAV